MTTIDETGSSLPRAVDPLKGTTSMETAHAQQPISLSPARAETPAETPGAAPRRSPGRLILGLATIVAVAGLAFAGGRLTAPAVVASMSGTGTGDSGGFAPGNGTAPDRIGDLGAFGPAGGSMSIAGTVASVSATSITVTLASGATAEIPVDSATTFHTSTAATASSVMNGSTVTVQVSRGTGGGTGTADGSGTTGGSGTSGSGAGAGGFGTATDITVTAP